MKITLEVGQIDYILYVLVLFILLYTVYSLVCLKRCINAAFVCGKSGPKGQDALISSNEEQVCWAENYRWGLEFNWIKNEYCVWMYVCMYVCMHFFLLVNYFLFLFNLTAFGPHAAVYRGKPLVQPLVSRHTSLTLTILV